MAEIENDKSEDIVMSDNNDDNSAMSDNDSLHAIPGNDNAEDSELGENSTEDAPSPLTYGRKTNDPTKVKTSKRCRPIKVTPLESPMGNPHVDKDTTCKTNSYVFDPTDVRIHEFFFEGTPNPKDLEGVEEDKILAKIKRQMQKEKEILQKSIDIYVSRAKREMASCVCAAVWISIPSRSSCSYNTEGQ